MTEDVIVEHKTILGLRASALLEIAIFFVVALLIDALSTGGTRFMGVEPHPFWIIVVLIACQYGTAAALVAALIATVALLFGNIPAQIMGQDMYAYALSVFRNPLMWFVAAVVLGELRQRHIRERTSLQRNLMEAETREEKIAQSYSWTRELKEKLELRIAGQLRSSIATYKAAKAMEKLHPSEVLSGIEELITALMSPDKFSIYAIENDALVLNLSHGWKEQEPYNKQFNAQGDLYRTIVGERKTLCVANPEQEAVLSGQGVLAGPLVDRDTGTVVGMLKIEKLGFADLNLSSIETFNAICEWAGMAVVNARKYQLAKSESMVNPDHNLLTANYFQKHLDYIVGLGKRVGFDVTMLLIRVNDADRLNPDERTQVARILSEAVDKVLRAVDLAFDYQPQNSEYSIVLPATHRAGADIVVDKIRRDLASRTRGLRTPVDFTYSVQPLFAKGA